MKLLNRTSYILLTTIIFVFFVGSITFYFVLKSSIDKEIRDELESRMEFVRNEFSNNPEALKSIDLPGYIQIETMENGESSLTSLNDTLIYDLGENNFKPYRYLASHLNTKQENYKILVFKSLEDSNDLVENIVLVLIAIIILFILSIYILNRFLFEKAWSDFFGTITTLKSYDVNQGDQISFQSSEISEFDLLNSTLNQMIEKINKDYQDIKEFTGNISHEIQTPLTIIKQKSELLLQSEPLNMEQLKLITDIQSTNSRLSKLNRTLVLLTKVENKHFISRTKISLNEVIEQLLETFQSLTEIKSISVNYDLHEDAIVMADPMLIDVTVMNLIKNALAHNIEKGRIEISLDSNELRITNTSNQGSLEGLDIFGRYTKINKSSDSLGLGLSLVLRICEMYAYTCKYFYLDGKHVFSVVFDSAIVPNTAEA